MQASFRIGQGFDVHRFLAGRPLVLCGTVIPGAIGLDGHSDADVALHAVTDALLGAVSAGDIGEVFPASEERWRGADSGVFLDYALQAVQRAGYRLVNCDLTIVCEKPRIAPHREELRSSLANLLGVARDAVSVKATTTEGLGLTGRGEGMAALAVALVTRADEDE